MSCFQTEIRPHDSENKRRASQETGAESSKKKVKVIDIRHSSSEVHQESKSFGKFDWNYLNLTPPSAPLGKRFPRMHCGLCYDNTHALYPFFSTGQPKEPSIQKDPPSVDTPPTVPETVATELSAIPPDLSTDLDTDSAFE